MDSSSINEYIDQQVLLTLQNGFWYKAKIISVSEEAIVFIELKGRKISVSPNQVVMIEEVKNSG